MEHVFSSNLPGRMSDKQTPELTPETYTNRELSWIEFNRRVLALGQDRSLPLLERAKFLAIFSTNLDEFYMVRVAGWHKRMQLGLGTTRPDRMQPRPLLREIRRRVTTLMLQQRAEMRAVLAELAQGGLRILQMDALDAAEREALRAWFTEEVFPVLTPLAVDHARPFPFISNLSLNFAIWVRRNNELEREPEFVRLKVPDVLPRLVELRQVLRGRGQARRTGDNFLWLEDIISANLDLLFPGMTVVEQHPFRVTRNTDVDYEHEQEDRHLDISALIEETLREREFGDVVRLSVTQNIGERTLRRLERELQVDPEHDVYHVDGSLGAGALMNLLQVNRPEYRYTPWVPRVLPGITEPGLGIFDAIRREDILLHHPYDSFLPVEEFFRSAASDPNVLAIKTTLYRVGSNSPVVHALAEARENDKQVTVLVELKARFDEENNIEWARMLEHKGVHVTYGVEELPLKTHAKVSLVVRREESGVRRYVHLGTGNYNAATARLYTDLGLLTCDQSLGTDVLNLFNRLTGYAPGTSYERLLVAPEYLRERLLALLDGEIAAAQAGLPARVIFKMNQLEEDRMIRKLYQASQAGVQVDLLVRGLCCLVPGQPGVSENIRVHSLVGRFLEHSRIYCFQNAPAARRVYLGSADLMRRNLSNRVEVVFPLLNPAHQQEVLTMLATSLADNCNAWRLGTDGRYTRLTPGPDEQTVDSQAIFMEHSFGVPQYLKQPTV